MNAQEARRIALEGEAIKTAEQFRSVMADIVIAAKKHRFELWVDNITAGCKKMLEDEGYTIYQDPDPRDGGTIIRW